MSRLSRSLAAFAFVLLLVSAASLFLGCSGDSAETIIRNVSLQVAGFYTPVEGATTLTANNSGNKVTSLNLTQAGDQLDGVDNNGAIFRGTLGQVSDTQASFTLDGATSAGQPVTIAGTINVPEGSTEATMQGTWIEDTLFSAFAARATVPQNNPPSTNDTDNGSGGTTNATLTISATVTSIDITGSDLTSSISASGGDGNYTFSVSDSSLGTLSSTTANPTTYTANPSTGTQTINVGDGAGASASVDITQTSGS